MSFGVRTLKVLLETNYPVNNVVLPGTACTLGIYRLNHQPF